MTAQLLWILAPFLLFLAVVSQRASLGSILRILVASDPRWFFTAFLLQVGFVINQGAFYRSIFRLFGVPAALSTGTQLALVMAFAGQAFPGGTAIGIAYFVACAQRRGIPPSRALATSLAYYLYDYGSFLVVLAVGVVVLLVHHEMTGAQLTLAGVFLGVTLIVGAGAGWMVRRRGHAAATAERLVRAVNRLSRRVRGRPLLAEGRAEAWAAEMSQIVFTALRRPDRGLRPAVHALLVHLISLGILACTFRALGSPVQPDVLIAGYAMGVLFSVFSVTPSGVGVVEGAVTVVLVSLVVPVETAVAVTLLFRLVTLWVPFIAGFLTFRLAFHGHAGEAPPLVRVGTRPPLAALLGLKRLKTGGDE